MEWNINDLILSLDVDDLNDMKRYEDAFFKLAKKGENLPKFDTRSQVIEYECKAIEELFDDIFGNGTSDKLFKDDNVRKHYDVYDDFLKYIQNSILESEKIKNKRLSKYSGIMNV